MIKKWVNSGVALWVALLSWDVGFFAFLGCGFFAFLGCICFFHPAALGSAFTNENTMVWLLCKRLVDRNGWGVSSSCWSLLLHTPARSVLVCVLCSALRCWRRDWYWHYTSDPCWSWESSGGDVEAVPHFHREELVVRNGGERFPPHVCISTCTAQFSFPKRVTNVVWSLCWAALQGWEQLPHPSVLPVLSPCPGRQPELPLLLGSSALTSVSNGRPGLHTHTLSVSCAHPPTCSWCLWFWAWLSVVNKCLVDEFSMDVGALPYAWN